MTSSIQVGEKVPELSLPSDTGEIINISNLKGKNVVLYFYPKDDTPGCTIEAKDFSCAIENFNTLNTIVIGISKDDLKLHTKFREKHQLKHILLSDMDTKVSQRFDCWVEKSMYGKKYMAVARKTFLIDKDGIIQKIWPAVKIEGHVDDVLESIRSLK